MLLHEEGGYIQMDTDETDTGPGMEAKLGWDVVEMVIKSTDFRREDARRMLAMMQEKDLTQLFFRAKIFRNAVSTNATEILRDVLGDQQLSMIIAAVKAAMVPQHRKTKKKGDKHHRKQRAGGRLELEPASAYDERKKSR